MACSECFKGTIHEGTPLGKEVKIQNRDTYVAEPPSTDASNPAKIKGIVVILHDAFGWTFVNNRILADELARKGSFRVYLPDFLDGRVAPLRLLDEMPKLTKTGLWANLVKPYYYFQCATGLGPFLIANRPGVSMPKILPFFENLRKEAKEQGLPLGVAGYCWGGKPAIDLAATSLIDCAYIAHPSNLTIPGDFEKVRVPLSMAIGDNDFVVGVKEVEKARAALASKKDLKSEVTVYPGATHGFAVRGDPGNEKEKAQGIEAEDQAVNWFTAHFTTQ